jgi:tRNA(Leu) C34 or U34 (ribose-2'-O)-methylase TrmL
MGHMGIVTGPVSRGDGVTPAIALVDPKYPHNAGAAVRAASCYGVRQVWFSGDRVRLDGAKRQRLPREERMRRNAESLIDFEHPEHALYVFGPEDGSLDRAVLTRCPEGRPGVAPAALERTTTATLTQD